MPLDDNHDAVSSDGVNDEANAASNDTAATAPADSSTATGANDVKDGLLSVVRDVVDASRKKPEETAASPAEGEETGQTGEEAKDEDGEPPPFHEHPRWKQLLTQRNSARAERDGYKGEADQFRQIASFIDDQGMSREEAANLLIIGGLMKTNPVEAWKQAKPVIQKLLVEAGEVLPDDLRQMVGEGKMDQAAALEVSRSRAAVKAAQFGATFQQQRQERQQTQAARSAIAEAATTWERDRKAKDPNFAAKLGAIEREVAYLQRADGIPNTPDGVKAQLDKAYKAVNASLPRPATPAPKPVPKTPIRANGSAPVANVVAAGSTLDIVNQHIARRGTA